MAAILLLRKSINTETEACQEPRAALCHIAWKHFGGKDTNKILLRLAMYAEP